MYFLPRKDFRRISGRGSWLCHLGKFQILDLRSESHPAPTDLSRATHRTSGRRSPASSTVPCPGCHVPGWAPERTKAGARQGSPGSGPGLPSALPSAGNPRASGAHWPRGRWVGGPCSFPKRRGEGRLVCCWEAAGRPGIERGADLLISCTPAPQTPHSVTAEAGASGGRNQGMGPQIHC